MFNNIVEQKFQNKRDMNSLIKLGFLCILLALAFAACEGDPMTSGDRPAGITFIEGDGLASDCDTVISLRTFCVDIEVIQGDTLIKAIAVREDGVLVDVPRMTYDGTPAPANPWLLPERGEDGFLTKICIQAHDDESTRIYTIEIIDDADRVSTDSIKIATVFPPTVMAGVGDTTNVNGPCEKHTLNISISDVNIPLLSIGVEERGRFINVSRLESSDIGDFMSNPKELFGDDKEGFTTDLFIKAHETPGAINQYTLVLEDELGFDYEYDFSIQTGTSVDDFNGILRNAAESDQVGTLDLDTGQSENMESEISEIRDEGIDENLVDSLNWRQQIAGVNKTEVRQLIENVNGLPATFSFDNIVVKEEIPDLWGQGELFTETNDNGDLISDRIDVGDTFIANRGDTSYWVFRVARLDTSRRDNEDSYTLNIKF